MRCKICDKCTTAPTVYSGESTLIPDNAEKEYFDVCHECHSAGVEALSEFGFDQTPEEEGFSRPMLSLEEFCSGLDDYPLDRTRNP